jgi:hypothetical protein
VIHVYDLGDAFDGNTLGRDRAEEQRPGIKGTHGPGTRWVVFFAWRSLADRRCLS